MLLLGFIVAFRLSKGEQACFYYPRHGICKGERDRQTWHAINHTTKQKACAWHVQVFVDMIVKGKHLSYQKASIHGMGMCSGIAIV